MLSKNPNIAAAMHIQELDFHYPHHLVATAPQKSLRVLYSPTSGASLEPPQELDLSGLLALYQPGDLLVLNNTYVHKRRVFTQEGFEICFVKNLGDCLWEVLCPVNQLEKQFPLDLPGGIKLKLHSKGLPQIVETSKFLDTEYFQKFGEFALPPYIQKARGERKPRAEDNQWYQNPWGQNEKIHQGSVAAPTASLHFNSKDLNLLSEAQVELAHVTLHVGLGTFLPIHGASLKEHKMHSEEFSVLPGDLVKIQRARKEKRRIWALGTTVVRVLETLPRLEFDPEIGISGSTDIFITPGFEFKIVDMLMTNFHQPKSTLLALVMAFAGCQRVKSSYEYAIEKKFQLFSYGDLSVWERG